MRAVLVPAAMALLALSWHAAAGGPPSRSKPTKEEMAQADEKFQAGEKAYAQHDYRAAATSFEEAYALAPHPDALLNAVEARERAGDLTLAATLCAELLRDFPDHKAAADARQHLATLTPKIGRLELTAGEGAKDVVVDGKPAVLGEVFVDPGDHVVSATLGGVHVERRVSVVAGARENVLIEPAAPKPVEPPPKPPPPDERPLHPAVFFVGLGLTAVSGALLIWSGVDTLQARDAVGANTTQGDIDDGNAKQTRTNVLIGVTAGLGVATAAIGIFATEWSFGHKDPSSASLRAAVGAGTFALEARY